MNFGLIADGNRRWAKANNKPIKTGHLNGFLAIRNEIFPYLDEETDFTALTVYGFSTENWKRNPLEIKNLMDLFSEIFDGWVNELIEKKVRFIHAGNKNKIPKKLAQKLKQAEEISRKFSRFTIYLCLDYGSRDELIRTINKLNQQNLTTNNTSNLFTEEKISQNLEVPELDIVFRTGGEQRISNFCLWQAAYAEFFYNSKPLPDIKKADIKKIIQNFKQRDRRVGK